MNFLDYLNTPFPRPRKSKKFIFWIFLVGFSCSLFVVLYKPFGIENVNNQWYFNLVIFSIGIVFILAILFIEWIIPSLFPKLFKNWTLGKALIWYTLAILFIGGIIFLYKSFLAGFSDFTLTEYFFVIGRTLIITLTVTFFTLGIFQYLNRKNISLISLNENYLVTSQDGKSLRINLKDILYISSDDNYVDIHFESDGERKKILFRSSLKNIESQLVNPLSPIYRCHRRYLINIEYFTIRKITSRNMIICLENYSEELPVSKQYTGVMKQLLPIHP